MKTAFALLIVLPLLLLAGNEAIHLLSEPSDIAVFGGYALICLIGFALAWPVRRVLRCVKPHLAKMSLFALILACGGCNRIVQPGHVGLLVKQTGSERGVQDYPIQSGRVFYNPLNETGRRGF